MTSIGHKTNDNKIKSHQKEKIKKIGDSIFRNYHAEKLHQQSSIAYLKVRSNQSTLLNAFNVANTYVDFRISSDFDKMDKINDLVLWMDLDVICNSYRESTLDNFYISPVILNNSTWLIDRVEYFISGTLYDTQRNTNLFIENCYKTNNDLKTEKSGGGYNNNYIEFDDNVNSIVYPNNTSYVHSLTPPTIAQCTQKIGRTIRFGRNLLNKFLLKAANDEFTIRVYFNTLNNINMGSPISNIDITQDPNPLSPLKTSGSLTLKNALLYMQGIKYSPIELAKQLSEKYIGKEYITTSLVRKYNSTNFSSVKQGVRQSVDIGNLAGTFNTFAVYMNYQNAVGSNYNQNQIDTSGITYTGVTPNRVPVFNAYKIVNVAASNGINYIVDQKQNLNPVYTATNQVFEMEVTLQDGNGDAYPYERNISDLVLKNFSAVGNNSDFIKNFSIYPFNFGNEPQKDYWDQTITSGHYVFDNSSTLVFTPTSDNVPLEVQLISVGTQLCQASLKNGRIYFKYL